MKVVSDVTIVCLTVAAEIISSGTFCFFSFQIDPLYDITKHHPLLPYSEPQQGVSPNTYHIPFSHIVANLTSCLIYYQYSIHHLLVPTHHHQTNCNQNVYHTAIQSIVAIGGGLYLSSPNQFKDKTTGKSTLRKPLWWQRSVRGAGIILFGLGAYRAGEVVQILYRRDLVK